MSMLYLIPEAMKNCILARVHTKVFKLRSLVSYGFAAFILIGFCILVLFIVLTCSSLRPYLLVARLYTNMNIMSQHFLMLNVLNSRNHSLFNASLPETLSEYCCTVLDKTIYLPLFLLYSKTCWKRFWKSFLLFQDQLVMLLFLENFRNWSQRKMFQKFYLYLQRDLGRLYSVDQLMFFRLSQSYVLPSWHHCLRRDQLQMSEKVPKFLSRHTT